MAAIQFELIILHPMSQGLAGGGPWAQPARLPRRPRRDSTWPVRRPARRIGESGGMIFQIRWDWGK
jgi:hypothetical protein